MPSCVVFAWHISNHPSLSGQTYNISQVGMGLTRRLCNPSQAILEKYLHAWEFNQACLMRILYKSACVHQQTCRHAYMIDVRLHQCLHSVLQQVQGPDLTYGESTIGCEKSILLVTDFQEGQGNSCFCDCPFVFKTEISRTFPPARWQRTDVAPTSSAVTCFATSWF